MAYDINTVYVSGHRNPDTDTVAASVSASYLKKATGLSAVPVLQGPVNKETAFVLEKFGVPVPEIVPDVLPVDGVKRKVILVDHQEYGQTFETIGEAEIIEIIDHHKIGDITTSAPIWFTNKPLGSTCTILYGMFRENNVEIPKQIAGLLISGLLSDTLLFKSPTTTETDKKVAAELCQILGFTEKDMEDYAMEMFKAGSSFVGVSIEDIFHTDFKEIGIADVKTGIAQVLTLDTEDILSRQDQFLDYMKKYRAEKGYFLTMLVVTDIIREGSYILFDAEDDRIVSLAVNKPAEQAVFVDGLVSRKKQVVPWFTEAYGKL